MNSLVINLITIAIGLVFLALAAFIKILENGPIPVLIVGGFAFFLIGYMGLLMTSNSK